MLRRSSPTIECINSEETVEIDPLDIRRAQIHLNGWEISHYAIRRPLTVARCGGPDGDLPQVGKRYRCNWREPVQAGGNDDVARIVRDEVKRCACARTVHALETSAQERKSGTEWEKKSMIESSNSCVAYFKRELTVRLQRHESENERIVEELTTLPVRRQELSVMMTLSQSVVVNRGRDQSRTLGSGAGGRGGSKWLLAGNMRTKLRQLLRQAASLAPAKQHSTGIPILGVELLQTTIIEAKRRALRKSLEADYIRGPRWQPRAQVNTLRTSSNLGEI
ncbi:hypothetical protein B0H17DRAFT_1137193 [Mycena rosella]|uniref:Uncharacterized protein n=1 Tax=Mycena rosella TaxID=1033263 RepID=A0AAD7D8X1_MYCRO|nr:hypothetical protein B0H17DRAFT_1137193 [Mycena rosella]